MSTLVKSAFWLTISEIVYNISGYIIHSGVGRILGPAEYGRYALVITLTTMVIILIGTGIPTAMAKYLSEISEINYGLIRKIKKQTIVLQTLVIGAITLLFFLAIPFIARAIGDPTLVPLFRISTLIIPAFAAASFYFYFYTGLHRFGLQAVLKTVRALARIAAIVGLALAFKTAGAVAGYIIAPLVVFFIALAIDKLYTTPKLIRSNIREHSPEIRTHSQFISSPSRAAKFSWKKLISFAWPVTLFLVFYELLISIDLYLVKGILHDDFLTGIYNGSLTIARIPYFLFYALAIILLPTISKTTANNNTKETTRTVRETLRLMIALLTPVVVLMFIYAPNIIAFFYGAEYLPAALPMQILVWGVGFLTIFYIMSFVANGAGLVKVPMQIALWGMIVNVVLNYILIQKFGIMGSAIATSITSVIIMAVMLVFIKRRFQGFISLRSLIKMLMAAAAIYGISFLFPPHNIFFISWSAILFGIYLAILFFLGEIKKEDVKLITNIIKR